LINGSEREIIIVSTTKFEKPIFSISISVVLAVSLIIKFDNSLLFSDNSLKSF
jgi:hypothetical protein